LDTLLTMSKSTSFVAGRWDAPGNGAGDGRPVLDPARGTPIAEVVHADGSVAEEAASAAAKAFEAGDWRSRDPMERGDVLAEIARRLRERADVLARTESLNVGKPIAQARGEVAGAAEIFDYHARLTASLEGDIVQQSRDQVTLVAREPVGVVLAIVPWNFPLVIACEAVAAALAAGCSVVLKPSTLTPLSALGLFEAMESLLPPGVANLVLGDGSTGEALVRDPHVDAVLFTGSTATGSAIMRAAADDIKRVGLELGGKAPVVVLDDAPLDAAVDNALARVVTNQGENCGAGVRVLVHESIHERFRDALVERAAAVTIGDPQDESIALGPMISADHQREVLSYVEGLPSDQCLFRGEVPDAPPLDSGFFAPLTLATSGPGTPVWTDEIFGPVQTIVPFADDDEAVALANDTEYGLFASIWAGDRGRALRLSQEIRAATIRINDGVEPLPAPWGGMKRSGIGRIGGKYGIEAVTELKAVAMGLG
jgi:acyl-CoA reductase-like NAD-dependent aldehyde dehydrogenase